MNGYTREGRERGGGERRKQRKREEKEVRKRL